MDAWKIISQLLGLQDVTFEDVKLYKKKHEAVFIVRQKVDSSHCSECGLKLGVMHDWQLREIQGPPMGIYSKVVIKLFYPRAFCELCCKNKPAYVPWLHPKFKSMTCGFAEIAGRLMEETTCEAASRVLKSTSRKLWDLDQWRMQLMLERMRLPKDIDISLLSADEVHFKTVRNKKRVSLFSKHYEIKYITNLVSYGDAKVLFNAPGRDSNALEGCLGVLSEGQKMAVESFAVDMHDPFIKVVKENLPNAEISVDRFHLTQQINKCFDKVRRTELSAATGKHSFFIEGMLAPSRRFVLIERSPEKNLTKSENKMLEKLRKLNENIHNAMLLVESFHRLLDKKSVKSFRSALSAWYWLVRESELKSFRKFARTIRKYRSNIESYITSHLTTAVSEGINNKIKVIKRMGYGYHNERSFMNKIMQRCGYLNHSYINTDDLLYGVPNPK